MIRLRRMLERGCAHPVLGPIVLAAVVLLLALVLLHAAHEGWDSAAEMGAICLGIAIVLGVVVLERSSRFRPAALVRVRGDRGPPGFRSTRLCPLPAIAATAGTLPLRR